MNDQLNDRLLDLAAEIIKTCDELPNTRSGNQVAGQIVRSGTSPGPNYEEACAAESRKDFIHKMSISLKELRESPFWLRLIDRANLIANERLPAIIDESTPPNLRQVRHDRTQKRSFRRSLAQHHAIDSLRLLVTGCWSMVTVAAALPRYATKSSPPRHLPHPSRPASSPRAH